MPKEILGPQIKSQKPYYTQNSQNSMEFGHSECNRVKTKWDNQCKYECNSYFKLMYRLPKNQKGPVVQSLVSLTSPLRGQLVKCFTTLFPNTLILFGEKMREAFALLKLLTFFQPKILAYLRYYHLKF